MNQEAIAIVQKCLETQDPYLDLGMLGLRDADFAEGTELDGLLRQCTHLKTLILSNSWRPWESDGEWREQKSRNTGTNNHFTTHPPALLALTALGTLVMEGDGERWGISDMGFVADLKALQQLNISYNQISAIHGLEGLSSLQQLSIGDNRISEIRGLDGLSSLQQLDLRGNRISEIRGLVGLSSLQQLDLRSNQISEIRGLVGLSSLQQLDLRGNRISEIRGLDGLSSLQQLDLSSNEISEIRGLVGLSSLQQLSIGDNRISEIRGLVGLSSLQQLDLEINRISAIRGLEGLSSLQQLSIGDNRISEIRGLDGLSSLQQLSIGDNRISEIRGLDALSSLQQLNLYNNKISEISGLGGLSSLQQLDLSSNEISEIRGLEGLSSLQQLRLYNNPISEIRGLEGLSSLQQLDLSSNQISEIRGLAPMASLTYLKLFGNPLRDMPPELAGENWNYNCINDCRNWWAETANTAHTQKNTLVKLQIIGNGGVGKTSLLEALEKGRCSTKHDSTHGIRVVPLRFDVPGLDIAFSAWDFGGQEIYHGTHRLFIGSEAVQVIVFAAEAEQCARNGIAVADRINKEEQVFHLPIAHYTQLCQRYSQNSQLIIVQNQLPGADAPDASIQHWAIDGQFGFAATDAITGRGILSLRDLLAQKGSLLRHYGRTMPQSWLAVRDYFLDNAAKTPFERIKQLTKQQFAEICSRHGVMQRSILSLLKLLHGTSLVYNNEELLKDTIITDLHWALEAIYAPLKRGSEFYDDMAKDHLGRVRVKNIFKAFGNGYSVSEKWLFLGFMASCRLCFALHEPHLPDDSEDRCYIFPQFLPGQATPAVVDSWANATDVQTFYCTLPYLDYYRIQQFIVTLGNKTPVQFIWKNGILVTTNLGMFMVTANQPINTIQVQIEQKAVANYLPYIIETFGSGTGQHNPATWMQGSDAATAIPVDMEAQRRQVADKEGSADTSEMLPKAQHEPIGGAATQTGHPITELPNVPQQRPKRLVISYASEDLSVRDALEKSLANYELNGQLSVQYDELAVDGEDGWNSDVKQMFEEADGYVILVSQDYQYYKKKKYIWQYEVPLMEARNEAGCFVWCMSAAPVDYNDRLSKFAAFKGGKEFLPETGHQRLQFLKDFAVQIIGGKFLNL